jgi:hypothetical protein
MNCLFLALSLIVSSIIAFKAGYNIYAYSSYLMGNKEIIHQSTPFDIPNDYHLIGIEHNNPYKNSGWLIIGITAV